ncbi:response regulator [Mumia sp. DW29H23]|uniref:response regulator n=1 Tax=Mumia sp. DW29H23 TaxID=3421241 RepID=UPI003D6892BD
MTLTLVIVDDHPAFRSFARALLEADGFRVVGEAGDAASAFAACDRLQPDVVLLDVVLPDEDGFAVCSRLSAAGGSCPSVVLTSSRPATSYGRSLTASAALGFVAKDELSGAALRSLLGAGT